MDYVIFRMSSGEDESSVEAHVLARAYRAAWRVKNLGEPNGAHQFASLDLVICYGGWAPPQVAISREDVLPTAQRSRMRCGGNGEADDD
ncbi:MAG: hypothetical protein JSU95_09850 [Betaproteobacteria bacterium]|nr:MAG: hypothetical protein JSU95_09850 [Betaproteobacteria bacterium]